jgi:hypothetical protein
MEHRDFADTWGRTAEGGCDDSRDDTISMDRPVMGPARDSQPQDKPEVRVPRETTADRAPTSVERARRSLLFLDNGELKVMLKHLRVKGAHNAPVTIKRQIVAEKMVQKGLALPEVEHAEECFNISSSSVNCDISNKTFLWFRGDVPKFDECGTLIPGEKIREETRRESSTHPSREQEIGSESFRTARAFAPRENSCPTRTPAFTANEFVRLIHVLSYPRMTNALAQIMKPRSRADLDREAGSIDPWSLSIAPLFNDANFLPQNSVTLSAGVTRDDVKELNPSRFFARNGSVLSRKFGELKSLYTLCCTNFKASGQSDPDSFPLFSQGKPHVMYLHCMVQENGFLEPLCTRTIPLEAQREEGCADYAPSPCTDERDRYKSRKRSRSASVSTDINCNLRGLEALKEVLEPVSKKLMLEAEEAEVLRSKSEAAKSQAEAISSTVKAISDLTAMAAGSEHGDKGEYEDMIESLRAKLKSLVSVGNLTEFSDKL